MEVFLQILLRVNFLVIKGSFTGANSDYIGIFRASEGGTILLDEISEMPKESQAKLLRVLQDKKIRL